MNNRIKYLRSILHLSQQQFSDRVGIKRSYCTNIETGRKVPSDLVINAICREYNVNRDWLYTGDGEIFVQNPNAEENERFRRRLIAKISKLTDEQLTVLEAIAEDFCNNQDDI